MSISMLELPLNPTKPFEQTQITIIEKNLSPKVEITEEIMAGEETIQIQMENQKTKSTERVE